MERLSIVEKPITEAGLSESFREMCNRHHFRTLADILNWPVSVLLLHDGFTYHHLEELRILLKAKGILHFLKIEPSQPV